ncbi:MAG: hypothetical protein NC048_07210 [Bacteroides sp.]|nr:hypothetical protein [Ruminococcus flavefaciens]MCM1555269.1 hypothetical protein [Bacteroides sp.]
MEKRNLLMIWAKHAFFALALAGTAGLMLPACEKEKDKSIYRAPYEKELFFNQDNVDSVGDKNVRKYVDDTACKHIYMVVESDNDYTGYSTEDINIVKTILQRRVELSDKVSGRGDFHFRPNTASVNDSLWFVQNGWTVRQKQY